MRLAFLGRMKSDYGVTQRKEGISYVRSIWSPAWGNKGKLKAPAIRIFKSKRSRKIGGVSLKPASRHDAEFVGAAHFRILIPRLILVAAQKCFPFTKASEVPANAMTPAAPMAINYFPMGIPACQSGSSKPPLTLMNVQRITPSGPLQVV